MVISLPVLLMGGVFLLELLSRSSRWRTLAERGFEDETPLRGRRSLLHSGSLGRLPLAGLITGVGADGVQLRVLSPLRSWFPNLLIPWERIEERPNGYRLDGLVTFSPAGTLGSTIGTGLTLYRRAQARAAADPALTPLLVARDALHRCPYCHDALGSEQVEVCAHCHTAQHTDCLREHGGCVVHACLGVRSLVPSG